MKVTRPCPIHLAPQRSQTPQPTDLHRHARALPRTIPAAQARIETLWREAHDILQGPQKHTGSLTVRCSSNELSHLEMRNLAGGYWYPTRDLFSLLALRDPDVKLVLLHEPGLDLDILHYYLTLLPGTAAEMRSRIGRLYMVPTGTRSYVPGTGDLTDDARLLSERVLDHPATVATARRVVEYEMGKGTEAQGLAIFQGGERLEALGEHLGLPLLGCASDQLWLGTKHGSRQIFAAAGIAYPAGVDEPLYARDALVEALASLCKTHPHVGRWMIKLSDGCASGVGNGLLDVRALPNRHSATLNHALESLVTAPSLSPETFLARLPELGAIIEAYVSTPAGGHKSSPSVQAVIHPDGDVEVLSSHEQVLDSRGQQFLGCVFPADAAYRHTIVEATAKVGEALRVHGVRGAYAVDYVTVSDGNTHTAQAIEINLRECGATHPAMQMRYVTEGHYNAQDDWVDGHGRVKHYVATDNLSDPSFKGLTPRQVIDAVAAAGLAFQPRGTEADASRDYTGVVLHLLPLVHDFGKLGAVCIAHTHEEAQGLMDALRRCLHDLAGSF